jgi:hypothetical protein
MKSAAAATAADADAATDADADPDADAAADPCAPVRRRTWQFRAAPAGVSACARGIARHPRATTRNHFDVPGTSLALGQCVNSTNFP